MSLAQPDKNSIRPGFYNRSEQDPALDFRLGDNTQCNVGIPVWMQIQTLKIPLNYFTKSFLKGLKMKVSGLLSEQK